MQMIRPVEIEKPESTNAETEGLPRWEREGVAALTDEFIDSTYSPDGFLAMLRDDAVIVFFDESENEITEFDLEVGSFYVSSIVWSGSGNYIAFFDRVSAPGDPRYEIKVVDVSDLSNIFMTSKTVSNESGRPIIKRSAHDDDSILIVWSSGVARYNLDNEDYEFEFFEDIIDKAGESTYSYERTEPKSASSENTSGSSTDWTYVVCQNFYSDSFDEFAILAYDFENDSAKMAEPGDVGISSYHNEDDTLGDISKEPDGDRLVAWFASELVIINESDLSGADQQPSLDDQPLEIEWLSGETRYLIRKTNSPRLYVQDADDLSKTDLPSLESDFDSSSVTYKDSRIAVTSESGYGFRLYDRSDLSEVEGTNPSVTEGDQFIFDDKIYEALTDNNDRPDQGVDLDPATWLDRGYINPLRMFDGSVGSQTTADDVLEVSIKPESGQINAFALFNLEGANLRITMTDPDGDEYYDSGEIALLDESTIDNWWAFFFEPYIQLPDQAITEVPPYVDGTINITVDALGSEAAIGEIVVGSIVNLGRTQYGSSVGIEDYSRKETDQFGNFDVVERGYSNSAEYDIHIEPFQTPGIKNLLAKFRATPAVYIGSPDRPSTIVYGYYRDFSIVLSSYSIDECTIEVEGLQ